jgi:hypothetical protein
MRERALSLRMRLMSPFLALEFGVAVTLIAAETVARPRVIRDDEEPL